MKSNFGRRQGTDGHLCIDSDWCVIKKRLPIPLHKIDQVQSGINYLSENHKWCQSIITYHWNRQQEAIALAQFFFFSVTARDYNKSEISIIQRLSWINNGKRVYLFSRYPQDINNNAIIKTQKTFAISLQGKQM